jgi:hypothetical protein
MSEVGGKAEIICSLRVFRILTQSRHRLIRSLRRRGAGEQTDFGSNGIQAGASSGGSVDSTMYRGHCHDYLDGGRRFEFTFTPKHGSWLNLIEGFFSKFARSVLRHIRVTSKHELKERILAGIDDVNRHPVIHTWSYKLAEAA